MIEKCQSILQTLCQEIPERCVGSEGNRMATRFFEKEITALGWDCSATEFDAIDWQTEGVVLQSSGERYEAFASPYSLGCDVTAELVEVSSIEALEKAELRDKVMLLHGEIAKEQLMPKGFVFYNPEEHQKIIALLEEKQPAAILTATGRNSALAGGLYPFPLIEDGDFDLPSVYMTEEEGQRLLARVGELVEVKSVSARIPGKGVNLVARKGRNPARRIVVTAHIDAKKGTPGAIDNATGVAVLLLLADLLKNYAGENLIEIVALNGEDYFAVPGQMTYIRQNQDRFSEMLLNINIDGAGYHEGPSAYSFYDLPERIEQIARQAFHQFPGIVEGSQWPQGDHSIFIQFGCPAIALTSKWFNDHVDVQDVTHTPKDNLTIVDPVKVVEIAQAIQAFIIASNQSLH